MASNDDFFGGFFDLDGDGKTDMAEQLMAYKFFEELEKEENEDDHWHASRTSTVEQRRPSKPLPSEQPIPEQLTLPEYKRWKRIIINGCIISLILYALFCILPGILIWASITSYDPRNSASLLVVSVFCLVGFGIIVCILIAAASSINDCSKRLQEAKDAYLSYAKEEK